MTTLLLAHSAEMVDGAMQIDGGGIEYLWHPADEPIDGSVSVVMQFEMTPEEARLPHQTWVEIKDADEKVLTSINAFGWFVQAPTGRVRVQYLVFASCRMTGIPDGDYVVHAFVDRPPALGSVSLCVVTAPT